MPVEHLAPILGISVASAALAYASAQDLRRREVSDAVWIFSIPPSACLTAVWVASDPSGRLVPAALSVAASTALAVLLNRFGLLGGADGKAVLLMGVSTPLRLWPPRLMPSTPFPPLSALLNGLTLAALLSIFNLASNLSRLLRGEELFRGVEGGLWLRLLAMAGGRRVRVSETDWSSYVPLEELRPGAGGAVRRLRLPADVEGYEGLVDELLSAVGPDGTVWATQGVPLIPFMLAGLALTMLVGDPVLALSKALSSLLTA